jgi:hypothetical protein
MTEPLTGIHYNLSSEEYRAAPGDSATFLKAIVSKSVAHALVPKKPTVSTNTGLRLHLLVLERETFYSQYEQGLNPEGHQNALQTASELRAVIDGMNTLRKPKLKTTGSKEQLLESIVADDEQHLSNVPDASKLTASDLKKRVQFINKNPNRGLLSTSGTISELTERLRANGYTGEIWPELVDQHSLSVAPREVLPFDEYQKYEDMYQSLLAHLKAGDEPIFKWLLYAFTTPGVLKAEVSMFSSGSKCRFDGLFQAGQPYIGFDLKSTQDASEAGFMWQSAKYGYDVQVAHYLKTAGDCGVPIKAMPIIAIEPEPPYATAVYIPNEEFIETGFRKRQWAIEQHKKWLASDSRTAYTPKSKELIIPERYMRGPWDE